MNENPWSNLGAALPRELSAARLAAHFAAQPMAAAAYALLPMREDHSHTNFLWSEEHGLFVGRSLPRGGRCFLDVPRLRTGLIADSGTTVALDLAGQTLDQAFEGMAGLLREVGEEVPAGGLQLPSYDLPEAPVAAGAPFEAPHESLRELGSWFAIGARALSKIAANQLEGAELRGWPHHFDLAALLSLDEGADAESARSVGAGLSPGDGSYDEPYFYVSPWPYPAADALPDLPDGAHWHTEGFTAATLTASSILERRIDMSRLTETLQSTVSRCLQLL